MKAFKIILIVVVVLMAVVVILGGAGLYFASRYVQSPAFKEQVLAAARQNLGSEVRIDELKTSLFSGVALRGVTIGNPTNFPGNLLTADAFVLRYRLLPLLHRRIEIEQLSLDKPVITLARNDKGEWNYEKLGSQEKPGQTQSPAAPSSAGTSSSGTSPLDIALERVEMNHASVVMLGEAGKELLRINDANFSSSVSLHGGQLTGKGQAGIAEVAAGNSLFIRGATAPVMITTDSVKLTPLSGKVADGAVGGDAALQLKPVFKYVVNLQVKNSDVAKLLAEAGTKQVMNGKLAATASLEGTGGLPTMTGNGRAEIKDGRLMEIPILNLLATLLQVTELRDLKFTECLLEFSITNNTMQTPVIRVASLQVQISGKGVVSLADYSLNHDLTISFAKGMLDRAPKEVRKLFTEHPDGSLALDFRVWGPYDAPKTDLQERIVKGVGQQLIEKGLQNLLK